MFKILSLTFFLIALSHSRPECEECAVELLAAGITNYVCGENGITYLSECFADCNRVDVAFEGRCPRHYCVSHFYPICGKSGRTWMNKCELDHAGDVPLYRGVCDQDEHISNLNRRTPEITRVVRKPTFYPWP